VHISLFLHSLASRKIWVALLMCPNGVETVRQHFTRRATNSPSKDRMQIRRSVCLRVYSCYCQGSASNCFQWLDDRYGKSLTLLTGAAAFSAVHDLVALVPDIWLLVPLQFHEKLSGLCRKDTSNAYEHTCNLAINQKCRSGLVVMTLFSTA
jgi:hypothetical protein